MEEATPIPHPPFILRGQVLSFTGNLAPGHDADIVLLDLNSSQAIEQRMAHIAR